MTTQHNNKNLNTEIAHYAEQVIEKWNTLAMQLPILHIEQGVENKHLEKAFNEARRANIRANREIRKIIKLTKQQ